MKTTANIFFAFLLFTFVGCQEKFNAEEEAQANTNQKSTIRYEQAFPRLDGKLVKVHYNGLEHTAIKMGDKYVIQGDILISEDQLDKPDSKKGTAISGRTHYWADNIVYYTVSSSLDHTSRIDDAISHIERYTNLRFEYGHGEGDYIKFTYSSDGTYSNSIGVKGGRQIIGLADWADRGSVIHEICHAIGIFHEQSREDRDQYINVYFNNIDTYEYDYDGTAFQFEKYSRNYYGFDHGSFDFNSIMLYPSDAFAKHGTYTMTKKNGDPFWGQRNYLSRGDIALIDYIYN